MKLYLVKESNPCFDCSTEDIIGIFDSAEKAQKIASLRKDWEVEEVELNSIITNLYHQELRGME